MIYCGQTASLAALEVPANSAGLPSNMVIIQARIPDTMKIKTLEKADLPGDWSRAVPRDSTKDIGTNWPRPWRAPFCRFRPRSLTAKETTSSTPGTRISG
jgi:hypothetical protein